MCTRQPSLDQGYNRWIWGNIPEAFFLALGYILDNMLMGFLFSKGHIQATHQ